VLVAVTVGVDGQPGDGTTGCWRQLNHGEVAAAVAEKKAAASDPHAK